MALMRIKYIDPADNECGLDQDVPRHLVTVINKRTADGLQEGVLYWPKKGGKGKGKGKKVKEYRVAIVEDNTTPLPSPVRPTGAHGKGQFDKPEWCTIARTRAAETSGKPAAKRAKKSADMKTLKVVEGITATTQIDSEAAPAPTLTNSPDAPAFTTSPATSLILPQSVINYMDQTMFRGTQDTSSVETLIEKVQSSLQSSLDSTAQDIKDEIKAEYNQLQQKIEYLESTLTSAVLLLQQAAETRPLSSLHSPYPTSNLSFHSPMYPNSPACSSDTFRSFQPAQQSTSYPAQQPPPPQPGTSYPAKQPLEAKHFIQHVRSLGNPPPSPTKGNIENVCAILHNSGHLISKKKYTLVAIKLAHRVIYGTDMMAKANRIEKLPAHMTEFLKSVMRQVIPPQEFDTNWEEVKGSITRSCKT